MIINSRAGIGGAYSNTANEDGGSLIINGGNIRVSVNGSGSAIGSNIDGSCDLVEINGGYVLAEAAHAPGIGACGNRLKVVINGGTVIARGGSSYPGIGITGSSVKPDASVEIHGGTVEAYGGTLVEKSQKITSGAGIGGGGLRGGSGINVLITGGKVTASGGTGAPGIGGGTGCRNHGTLTINDSEKPEREKLEILAGSSQDSRIAMINAQQYMDSHFNYVYIHPIPGYTVRHIGDAPEKDTLLREEWKKAHTGAETSAQFSYFEGYQVDTSRRYEQTIVKDDGSTVVDIYYKWIGKNNSGSEGTTDRTAGVSLPYSSGWTVDAAGNWMYQSPNGKKAVNTWLCDDAVAANGRNIWYLIGADGKMVTAGLIQDAEGRFYSIETAHNGFFGMLRYQDGWYDCGGKQVYLTFNREHNGSFGAITGAEGLEKLKAVYGVTQYGIGNENSVYTSTF